jgi:hypothetical protein
MGYADTLRKSFSMAKLNEQAMLEVANNPSYTGYGFLTLALVALAWAIGSLNPLTLFFALPLVFIMFFLSFGFFHLVAKLFGGQATAIQYLRTFSNAYFIYWIGAIPLVGWLLISVAGLWLTVVNIFMLRAVHRLSTAKAVIVGLIPTILFVIFIILAGIAAMAYFGVLSPERFLP